MDAKTAIKALDKIKWTPGENFRHRSPEDQKTIRSATLVLARAGEIYTAKKAAKKAEGI